MLTRRELLSRAGLASLLAPPGMRHRAPTEKGARVASYVGLGSVKGTATKDTTGVNSGNFTASFGRTSIAGVDSLPAVSQVEAYHISISGAAVLVAVTVNLNNRLFTNTTTNLNGGQDWDPSQPLIVNYGDQVDFLFTQTATGTGPLVTMWLRYDTDLARNHQTPAG
jgi:hypothetical protein